MFKVLTIVYNTLQGKASPYLREKLKQKHFPRTTRQSTSSGITMNIPFNKKKIILDRGSIYAAPKYWNDLPEYIRKAKNIKEFKSLLKTHFFKLAFPFRITKANTNSQNVHSKTVM